jgi:hypothetical protein
MCLLVGRACGYSERLPRAGRTVVAVGSDGSVPSPLAPGHLTGVWLRRCRERGEPEALRSPLPSDSAVATASAAEVANDRGQRHVMRSVEGVGGAAVVERHGRGCPGAHGRTTTWPHSGKLRWRTSTPRPWAFMRSTMIRAIAADGHAASLPPDSSSSGPGARSTGMAAAATASACPRAAA